MSVDSINAQSTLEVVRRFNEAFNRHAVDGVMAVMTEDCFFGEYESCAGRKAP